MVEELRAQTLHLQLSLKSQRDHFFEENSSYREEAERIKQAKQELEIEHTTLRVEHEAVRDHGE